MTAVSGANAIEARRPPSSSQAMIATGGAIACVLVAPILSISVPWFCDLFFHMARMAILENPQAPYVSDWYRMQWQLLPNLAMDLVVPTLARAMGVAAATRVFIALTFVLILSGTLALHRAVHKKASWFPFVACLFVYNWIVFLGFFNFLFGVGLLLWALALWFGCAPRSMPLRLLAGSVLALLLYVCHLFSLGLFAVVIAGAELHRWRREKLRGLPSAAGVFAAASVPFVAPLVLLLTSRTVAASTPGIEFVTAAKLFSILTPFITIDLPVDFAVAGGTIVLLGLLIRARALEVAPELRFALMAMPVLVLAIPTSFFGTDLGDFRLPAAAIFIAVAACRIDAQAPRRLCIGVAFGVATLFALRMTAIAIDFATAEKEIGAITEQYRRMVPGAVVFTGTFESNSFVIDLFERPESWLGLWHRRNTIPLRHIGTLALVYRSVFVPETTMIDGQQPVVMLPPYRRLKSLQTLNHTARTLADNEELHRWLLDIKETMASAPLGFSAVYIALSDPNGTAMPPDHISELFSAYGYRIWDATAWMAEHSPARAEPPRVQ
jgi:hypothetical protein